MNTAAMAQIPAGTLHHKASTESAVQPIEMPAFEIGIHLVTVADYADFIDEGYDDPSLWSAPGWAWRLEHDIEAPRFWAEAEWAAYLVPTHPVVGVSAYEAEAYASFVGKRLPSEQEWERACRGDDARDYPWGNDWRDGICGHRNFGTRCTKPVGSYPESASPFGIHDLVGNVWQWTSDRRADAVIVCGGAWNNLPWSLGAAGRNAYPPTAQFSNLGFRLAGP